jgi:hypothetical protein
MAQADPTVRPGVGLDIGTMNIVSARYEDDDKVGTKRIRDAFLDLEPEAKRQLRLSKANYVEKGDALIVLGDSALTMANIFKRDVRRPLSKGLISSGEIEGQEVLSIMIGQVLGKPSTDGEHCFYSVPAEPIDNPGQDVIYHTEVFRKIVTEHGYTAHPMNEAMAIVYSQCAAENFSGLAVSFGSGMCNVALSYQTQMGLSFSLARGGDWIDAGAAKALGKSPSQVCAIKEKGVDLLKPEGREAEAVALYIRALDSYCIDNIAVQFRKSSGGFQLPESIPFILSGGTTKAGGFVDLFKQEFESRRKKGFPIEISEIRVAKDPMTSVAEGLLVLAGEEHAI